MMGFHMFYMLSITQAYAEYSGETEADCRKMRWHDSLVGDPLPDLAEWPPPQLLQNTGQSRKNKKLRPVGDAPRSGAACLISERAADKLGDILDRHARLYPVVLLDDPDHKYFMVVVQTELDCLDVAKSTGRRPILEHDKRPFMTLDTWVFQEECVGDADMFVLPYRPWKIFVSELFKDRIVEAGLKGFCLQKESWEDNPFVS